MNRTEIQIEIRVAEDHLAWLRKRLDEPEKPKLRHGDFGVDEKTGEGLLIVHQQNRTHPIISFNESAAPCGKISDGRHCTRTVTKLCNVYDLLREQFEDLTEFKVGCTNDKSLDFHLRAELHRDNSFRIGTGTNTIIISAKQTEKYWRKLGRMIATHKRKENKK